MTIVYDNREDCLVLNLEMKCSGAEIAPIGFYNACSTALDMPECVDVYQGALLLPEACVLEE